MYPCLDKMFWANFDLTNVNFLFGRESKLDFLALSDGLEAVIGEEMGASAFILMQNGL